MTTSPNSIPESNPADAIPDLLAVSMTAAARMIGISSRSLWLLVNRGEVPHFRVGRRVLLPLPELRAWIAARTKGGTRHVAD